LQVLAFPLLQYLVAIPWLVVLRCIPTRRLLRMHPAPTVQGGELTLSTKDGKLMIEDGQGNMATVIQADVMQSNGVVHVIDTVLMPGM
jgi:uncharacterized surface protein with fasciclin (FAS1) repeats